MEDLDILSVVLYSVFSALVLVSNCIVIIVIIRSRQLRQPTLWNIAIMAALDFALGLCVLVFIVPSKILNAFAYSDSFGGFSTMLMSFIVTQNAFNIMLALVDRYIAICWPLHYPRLMSAKRFTLAIVIVLFMSFLRVITLWATDGAWIYSKTLGFHIQKKQTLVRSLSRLPAFMIAFIIVGLMIRIRVELSKMKRNGNTGNRQSVSTQFTYTMYLSTLVYILCYIPISIVVLVTYFMQMELVLWKNIGMICVVSNSLWNVFVYAATYRPFRDAILKVFFPTYFRERARREVQVQFQRNGVSVVKVTHGL